GLDPEKRVEDPHQARRIVGGPLLVEAHGALADPLRGTDGELPAQHLVIQGRDRLGLIELARRLLQVIPRLVAFRRAANDLHFAPQLLYDERWISRAIPLRRGERTLCHAHCSSAVFAEPSAYRFSRPIGIGIASNDLLARRL